MNEHYNSEHVAAAAAWPRDFDIRASRAEQQELLARQPAPEQQPAEGTEP